MCQKFVCACQRGGRPSKMALSWEDSVVDDRSASRIRLPHTGGMLIRLACAYAETAGIAPEPLLEQAGIAPPLIEDPHARFKVADQIEFVNLVADALKADFLGFHLALIPDLREIGLFYYVLASSDVLIDALQRGARYTSILNEGVSLKCVEDRDLVLSLRYLGVSRHLDRHQIESWMTVIVRICRQLT